MKEIPTEWIDKLFNCMEQFYGDRWKCQFNKRTSPENMYKAQWKSGMIGLSYDEIKNALLLCKRSAETSSSFPPHVVEFYMIAKGRKEPYINYHPQANKKQPNEEIQKKYMDEIRKKLVSIPSNDYYSR